MTGNQYLGVKIPVPADWATVAPTKIRKDLYIHYGISKTVVDRWIKETGVQPLGRYDRMQTVKKRPSTIKSVYRHVWQPNVSRAIDWSSAGKAADYLRRYFSNVHRCDIQIFVGRSGTWGDKHGLANHGRGFWNIDGKGILNAEQVVCLAKEKGFSV